MFHKYISINISCTSICSKIICIIILRYLKEILIYFQNFRPRPISSVLITPPIHQLTNASYSPFLYVLSRNMCINTQMMSFCPTNINPPQWWKLTLKCCISCEMDSKQHLKLNVVFNPQNLRHWKRRKFEKLTPNMISFNVVFVFIFNRPVSSLSSTVQLCLCVRVRLRSTFVFALNAICQIWDLSETLTFTLD